MRDRPLILLIFFVLLTCLVPLESRANVGSALAWGSLIYMVFGNAVLGLLEGAFLTFMFRLPRQRTILLMILANYLSAGLGFLFVGRYGAGLPDLNLNTIGQELWRLMWWTFGLTLVIELPIFVLILRGRPRRFYESAWAGVLVHACSYALLVVWICQNSRVSMIVQFEQVPVERLGLNSPYVVYYLTPDGSEVRRVFLRGPGAESEAVMPVEQGRFRADRLFARRNENGTFDLCVLLGTETGMKEVCLRSSFASEAVIDLRCELNPESPPELTWMNFGPASPPVWGSKWRFSSWFWAGEGLIAEHLDSGRRKVFAVDTLLGSWTVRNLNHLPGDWVVFQLGDGGIYILHPEKMQIALIAQGMGPVVCAPQPIKEP